MSGKPIDEAHRMAQRLASELAAAAATDEHGDGCDIAAGLFGPATTAWLMSLTAAPALAQQPAAVDEATIPAWRVMPFTGSWKACDERWEVYSPDGSGGVVLASEVRSRDVADLLDALAAQPGGA